jgi:type I restriction enzyme M protein
MRCNTCPWRQEPFGRDDAIRCTYEELTARDKVNLDITLVRDPSLDDADSLLPPDVIAREIVEDLEAALSEFAAIAEALQREKPIADGTTD